MKRLLLLLAALALAAAAQSRVEVSFAPAPAHTALDGRVFLYVARPEPAGTPQRRLRRGPEEPRFEIGDQVGSQQVFGKDVLAWTAGAPVTFDASVYGYPVTSLGDLPAGDYTVQALFNRYTTFHRADGHTLLLPQDEGEGQDMTSKPGNFYSTPLAVHFDPHASGTLKIEKPER